MHWTWCCVKTLPDKREVRGLQGEKKLILVLLCFSVLLLFFSAALSSSWRPGGGWNVWVWSAGRTGHCVGRSSASASLYPPWFVPFPAHSYVIICDKLLCSQATNPHVRGLAYWTTLKKQHARRTLKMHEETRSHTIVEMNKCAFSPTYSHMDSNKQNFWLQLQVGFVFRSQRIEDISPVSRLTLSSVQQTSVVLVVPSIYTSQF